MLETATAVAPRQARRVAVWGLRIVLALAFTFFGLQKFPSGTMWVRLFARIGVGQWFRYVTGVVEVVGGILLLVPRATIPAVGLLVCAMIGALLVHVFVVGLGPQTVLVSVLLSALLAVFRTRPWVLGPTPPAPSPQPLPAPSPQAPSPR